MPNRNRAARGSLLLFLTLFALSAVHAQEATESLLLNVIVGYCPPNLDGYGSTDFAPVDFDVIEGGGTYRDLGNGWGGGVALANLTYTRTIPAFAGEHPFFSGNRLEMAGKIELSPVTLETFAYLTLTPIAFLNFQAGASVGTGWSLGFVGLAVNPTASADPLEETPFGGAVLKAWASGTFQFDLAALIPGDWTHVVMQAAAKFEYRNNTAADKADAWVWQADDGMNFNGWRCLGTYVLGYQMPAKVDFVGLMLETEQYLGAVRNYGTMETGWGSDFVTLTISPLVNLSFDDRNSLTFLIQIKSTQDWTDASTRERSFQERDYEGRLFCLNRILFSYTHTFR